jgi:chromosome segregation ATPase
MSDETNIRFYAERIEELSANLAKTTKESITRKREIRELREKFAALEKTQADLTAERDAFRAKAEATPGAEAERVKALETELRSVKVLGRFDGISKSLECVTKTIFQFRKILLTITLFELFHVPIKHE